MCASSLKLTVHLDLTPAYSTFNTALIAFVLLPVVWEHGTVRSIGHKSKFVPTAAKALRDRSMVASWTCKTLILIFEALTGPLGRPSLCVRPAITEVRCNTVGCSCYAAPL